MVSTTSQGTRSPHAATTSRRVARAGGWLLGLLGVLFVIALWYVVTETGVVSKDSLPPPISVGRGIVDLLSDGTFLQQAGNTLWTWFLSMAVSIAAAVPLGILFGYFSTMYRPAVGLIHASRSVPTSILIPVSVLIFGLGVGMKVALTTFAIFWPILLSTIYGVRNVQPQLVAVARSIRWRWGKILFRVVLPSALPAVATGIRVAGGIAMVVVISVEMLGASSGLGTVIIQYEENLRPDLVYSSIVLTGVLGAVLYSILALSERKALPWAAANR